MSLINQVIRPDVRAMSAYAVADSEGFLKLDAMENPYTLPQALKVELASRLANVALNRYPVPSYTNLKAKICRCMGIPEGYGIMLGNGSDELISLVAQACATKDHPAKMIAPVPGFVMYALSAQFAGMEFIGIPLKTDFTLDTEVMLSAIEEHRPAVVYLSQPHNPTGTLFEEKDVIRIIEAMSDKGIVISDEAYQPFAEASFMSKLPVYPNLVVMRTVSKLGLAGIRLGYMSATAELLAEFDKVRPPYNVNVLTEATAEFAMDHIDVFNGQAAIIRSERGKLAQALEKLPGVEVFPSRANFLLVRIPDANEVFEKLLSRKILIKNMGKMHTLLQNCLRITVSSPEENRQFLDQFSACIQ